MHQKSAVVREQCAILSLSTSNPLFLLLIEKLAHLLLLVDRKENILELKTRSDN
ncbi:MAG: hypothetical protein ACI9P7_000582 [Candidatus Azotimanducaceae bacterium]|jgi:hypothetical protein